MDTAAGLGKQSRKRLGQIIRRTKGTVSVEQASDILKMPRIETAKLLARWTKQGWLSRVRRGLYVPVPLEARSPDVAVEDPTTAVGSIRQAVSEVDSSLPLNNIRTQREQADDTLSMERLFARLLTLFGLLAQQLASIGLYGVLAYSVSQRTHEIGIRMALGASRGAVLKMVLRQGITLTLFDVVLGLAGAYVLIRYLESLMNLTRMLYGVKITDPLTYAVIALLLILVALVGCLIPARRATKVDPMVALRYE